MEKYIHVEGSGTNCWELYVQNILVLVLFLRIVNVTHRGKAEYKRGGVERQPGELRRQQGC